MNQATTENTGDYDRFIAGEMLYLLSHASPDVQLKTLAAVVTAFGQPGAREHLRFAYESRTASVGTCST